MFCCNFTTGYVLCLLFVYSPVPEFTEQIDVLVAVGVSVCQLAISVRIVRVNKLVALALCKNCSKIKIKRFLSNLYGNYIIFSQ